ncbi:hypothetical protein Terro_0691 [Terriglobus roseus DSM 18391]|uniref:Uncharacterized protein n=1 Tax=Terriglobus roseus (strain DSM 18391 / NRRL B-41598 / KBS 63) TaxID=926566 RepID=I3ZCR0_TERRK|nr:hypothetical protein [Terriglobus roseus]AFL87028.1 hypothetical protein Terro_0691 [Terriglobus roseus DSM 18391]
MSESTEKNQKETYAGGTKAGHVDGAESTAKAEPSGVRGDNPATAGPGSTGIRSSTPENSAGHINPSAPGDTGTTPATTPRN